MCPAVAKDTSPATPKAGPDDKATNGKAAGAKDAGKDADKDAKDGGKGKDGGVKSAAGAAMGAADAKEALAGASCRLNAPCTPAPCGMPGSGTAACMTLALPALLAWGFAVLGC